MSSSHEKTLTEGKDGIQIIRGMPMSSVYKREKVEEALDYEPRDDDIIIATYPKTGTTWITYIVYQILTYGKSFPDMSDMWQKVIPFIEMTGAAAVDSIATKPRVYEHHFSLDKVKFNSQTRIIYVYRRPEDTYVSLYYFMKNFQETIEFDEYFENFLTGYVPYGDYFDHILSFWKIKNNKNFLLVSYEKLLSNTKEEVLRVANFLGKHYYDVVANDENVLDNILKNTSFDYTKKNLPVILPSNQNYPETEKVPKKKANLFRTGKAGDGKKYLNESQLKRLMNHAKEKLKGTELISEWNLDQ